MGKVCSLGALSFSTGQSVAILVHVGRYSQQCFQGGIKALIVVLVAFADFHCVNTHIVKDFELQTNRLFNNLLAKIPENDNWLSEASTCNPWPTTRYGYLLKRVLQLCTLFYTNENHYHSSYLPVTFGKSFDFYVLQFPQLWNGNNVVCLKKECEKIWWDYCSQRPDIGEVWSNWLLPSSTWWRHKIEVRGRVLEFKYHLNVNT